MNSKERMLRTLHGQATDVVPVAPHWLGVYKLEVAGLGTTFEETDSLALEGEALARVDMQFYERFRPDSFHLGTGGSVRNLPARRRSAEFQAAKAQMHRYVSVGASCRMVESRCAYHFARYMKRSASHAPHPACGKASSWPVVIAPRPRPWLPVLRHADGRFYSSSAIPCSEG